MATEATLAGRAAAILTTSEVNGAVLDMRNAMDGNVTIQYTFTLGSLTSCTLKVYAGAATPPTTQLMNNAGVETYSLTANGTGTITVNAGGCRYLMMSAQGVGTVTSSSLAFDYYYKDFSDSTKTDGQTRLDG